MSPFSHACLGFISYCNTFSCIIYIYKQTKNCGKAHNRTLIHTDPNKLIKASG